METFSVSGQTEPLSTWQLLQRRCEESLTVLALALMVSLPLLESFLRKFFHTGLSGSTGFVQHLVLAVGMLGGALAAREGRLLSLSTATNYLKGKWKFAALVFSNSFAAAIAFELFIASISFVLIKWRSGDMVTSNIPLWPVLLVMPFGFGLMTIRIIHHGGKSWKGRLLTLAVASTAILIVSLSNISPERFMVPALIALIVATILGAPIFTALGGAALVLFWSAGQPIAMVSVDQYRLAVDATLPAIPLFTLAGYFLAEGGASRRMIRIFQALFAGVRGGPAIVTAMICAFFTTFTGASGVTILALGGLLMPVLRAAGYSEKNALGFMTGAGSLGILFPPCLPLILYAVVATTIGTEISITKMFLGGIIPGILLMVLAISWGVYAGHREKKEGDVFSGREAFAALWNAKWELLVPVVALASLFSGLATTVEAAAFTALYSFCVESLIYRDLSITKSVPRIMTECGLLVGGVLLILGVAMGFTDYLFTASVPEHLVAWAKEFIQSPWVFILALNLFLLVVGCLMDIFSAIVVVAPLIIPLGKEFGIDPVHLGIMFLANLELGFLTPPVGMNLFLSSYRFRKPMSEVIRSVLPMLGMLLAGVLIISYVPFLTTWLPGLFR
jgi:tripartite ATP-independent transporter DctM subunit